VQDLGIRDQGTGACPTACTPRPSQPPSTRQGAKEKGFKVGGSGFRMWGSGYRGVRW